jgi:hypothetical protein
MASDVPLLIRETTTDVVARVGQRKHASLLKTLGDHTIAVKAPTSGARTGRHGAPSRGRPPAQAGGLRCEERARSHQVHRSGPLPTCFRGGQKGLQKVGQNRSRASERRNDDLSGRDKVPANAHDLPRDEARPTGFEPVTFGSVDRCSTSVPADARGPRQTRLGWSDGGRLSAIPRASERSRRGAPD